MQNEPDAKLIAMVLKVRRWFNELSSNAKSSLANIAEDAGVDRTDVSRLITLALLAPYIVERIIIGDHSAALTPERLRKACPYPRAEVNSEPCCWPDPAIPFLVTDRQQSYRLPAAGNLLFCPLQAEHSSQHSVARTGEGGRTIHIQSRHGASCCVTRIGGGRDSVAGRAAYVPQFGRNACTEIRSSVHVTEIAQELPQPALGRVRRGKNGGWYRDRTCDPYHVKVVLYR